jgi:DNA-directed RNA polymerase specialized sigma subunit
MIRNESEYQEAHRRRGQDREVAAAQRAAFVNAGFTPEEVDRGMEPLLSFQAQLDEEIAWYENVRRRNFPAIHRLTEIGQLLIAIRIANGLSQRQLADTLGVSEAVVSRDERNEYHGITVERAQRIFDALNESVVTTVQEPSVPPQRALVGAN